jgi:hypothetical protein
MQAHHHTKEHTMPSTTDTTVLATLNRDVEVPSIGGGSSPARVVPAGTQVHATTEGGRLYISGPAVQATVYVEAAAVTLVGTNDATTPAGRWAMVRQEFEGRYSEPLYADETCTEPLWDMCYPSTDMEHDDDAAAAAACAHRVAAAIAVMAYGLEAVR